MRISGSIALVTGANRGLGREFATQLLARGATKVYATARRPSLVDVPGVEVLTASNASTRPSPKNELTAVVPVHRVSPAGQARSSAC